MFVVRSQASGSNKNAQGQFVAPAVFDQTWIVAPGDYGGPNGDQIVLRLRFASDGSASDQDGAYPSSGAVQVDEILVELDGSPISNASFESGNTGGWTPYDRQAVADYVRDEILNGSLGNRTLWMTDGPVDATHVVRDPYGAMPDLPMPYAQTWVVAIDDDPEANWAHACRWVAINADLGAHTIPLNRTWPPAVLANQGAGPRVGFACADVTTLSCKGLEVPPSVGIGPLPPETGCRHAVLVSGGWNADMNYSYFADNLESMYRTLRELGYPRDQIFVYYADGAPLDLDNADGDGDHETGSDVEGEADRSDIRNRIQELCAILDPTEDVLFIYTTGHGDSIDGGYIPLWDQDGDGVHDLGEIYKPHDFGTFDTDDCQVCRLFVVMDQCYSGAFVPRATDGEHANSAFYSAARADETTINRLYMDLWDMLDISELTMNEIHHVMEVNADHLDAHPQTAEGTPENGDLWLDYCCGVESAHIPRLEPLRENDASRVIECEVCNLLPEDFSYMLSLQGDPPDTASGCNIPGPTQFTVLDPVPVQVPAGECARVRVDIARPSGMTSLFDASCYTLRVTNVERGNSFEVPGRLVDRRDVYVQWLVAGDVYHLAPEHARVLQIEIANIGSTLGTLAYQIAAVRSDTGQPSPVVSVDGLAPATAATGTLAMPSPGGSTQVDVEVEFVGPDPKFFHDLLFMADTNGDQVLEVMATLGLRALPDATTDAPPPGAAPLAPRVRLAPNPFNPTTAIRVDLPHAGRVRLEILDLAGRRIRTLFDRHLPGGTHHSTWTGRDDRDRLVASGIYVVRLATPQGVVRAKAVLLK
jgi:hypothetical protein